MIRNHLKTCRICYRQNFQQGEPQDKSHWIRFGPRHNAHLACLIKTRDAALIFRDLPTWRLELMPFMEIEALGLSQIFSEELMKREDRRPPKIFRAGAAIKEGQ